jgi:hypothetical protein
MTTMAVGNCCHIHAAVKEQLVIMSAFMRPCEIGHVTGISKEQLITYSAYQGGQDQLSRSQFKREDPEL